MHGFEHFFSTPNGVNAAITGSYNAWLVALSIFISIFSSIMALRTADMACHSQAGAYRHLALGMGTVSLGGGIWAMHFIGMLAYDLPVPVHYDMTITLMSLLPACAASGIALNLLSRHQFSLPLLCVSGLLVGAGIGTMHYLGMAAMQLPLGMYYHMWLFLLSIVIAVVLAIIALWIRFGLRQRNLSARQRLLVSGVVMGCAIAGMHYTGMSAVGYYGEIPAELPPAPLDAGYIALALAFFIVTVSIMVVALNALIRTRALYMEMEAGKSRLKATLDTAVDAIITLDTVGTIREFNPAAEKLFGWTEAEVLGCNIKKLMPEPDRSQHDGYLRNFLSSGEKKVIGVGREVMGLKKDGSQVPIRLAVGEMILHDERLYVGFVSDISERHALELSLREAAERAERAAEAKTAFLANMSHEIRTPMNAIIGFTQLLLDTELSANQRKYLNTIHQSSHSLLRLINDILDTTKMEQRDVALELKPFSLKAIAMQLESSLGLSAKDKGLNFNVEYPANMPEYFEGDQLRVLQILTNLVGNAVKFTETGSINIRFHYTDGVIAIEIQDTGIGMTQAQQELVFSPFTQADSSISRRFGGTGLGTTIARQLVLRMNGNIELNSQFGKGTVFHVWLPLAEAQSSNTQAQEQDIELPPLQVLIADDVSVNLELLSLTLSRAGHQVTTARDGAEAFEQFTSGQFDLILMDMHMPTTDGLAATRLIRKYEQQQARLPVPIIALTASVMLEDQQAAMRAGMNGFAVKPLDAVQLFREMARVLRIDIGEPVAEQGPQPCSRLNWEQGIALWGDAHRFRSALAQFFNELSQYQLPQQQADGSTDWTATGQQLHRLKGVVGNLALDEIHQLTDVAEQYIQQQHYSEAHAAMDKLQQLLAEAQQCYGDKEEGKPSKVASTPDALAPSLCQQLGELAEVLSHSELDDQLLQAVVVGLEQANRFALADQLKNAIDNFEFSKAVELLQQAIASPSSSVDKVSS
ncbi:response regulator receiver protein [Shewanella mangrovi]|uniref:Sensor protein FixL n=1 Tax=Shewanella mangrovi TaxID=1515746 RepID=A0A094JIX7_9GAMM|nr:MHYT domain-containing protein [Shewanella mangrovi]KFZ39157.1 response regulator receiver protein [Shewanella mangrovi]